MDDTLDPLIREIAARHGVALGRDDPILILQTINARLLEDGAKAQRAMLQTHKEELEAIAQRWDADARDKAERVLTVSLAASKDAMARMMQEGAAATTAAVRAEVDRALGSISKAADQARDLGRINLIASAITLVAASIALLATLFR
jgi:hypothetical protein